MHYYVLLYKIKSCNLIWVVKRDLHFYDLVDRIYKIDELKCYESDIDKYYIIKQNNCPDEIENVEEIKQFTIFKPDYNSELIFETE